MNQFFQRVPVSAWVTVKSSRWLWRNGPRAFRFGTRAIYGASLGLCRALFTWRNTRRVVFSGAIVATLIAAFYTVENWRGRRAWMQARQALAERGETLELSEFIPPPVPDEQNFALAEYWKKPRPDYGLNPRTIGSGVFMNWYVSGEMAAGIPIDLRAWQQYYREARVQEVAYLKRFPKIVANDQFPLPDAPGSPAECVLLAAGVYKGALDELREAALRPKSRFPLRYEDGFRMRCPHVSDIYGPIRLLYLHGAAELECGRTEQAFADVKLQFRLAGAIENEPQFMAHGTRVSIIEMMLSTVWEGAARHQWSDAQLADMQGELERLDFLADFDRGIRFQRLQAAQTFEYMKQTRDVGYFRELAPHSLGGPWMKRHQVWERIYRYMPAGWFDQNAAAFEHTSLAIGDGRRGSDASSYYVQIEEGRNQLESVDVSTELTPYRFLLAALDPIYPKRQDSPSIYYVYAEALVRMARIACALERDRLATGAYPEELSALVPRFTATLPVDVVNGHPFVYRLSDSDHFILYSIGWNGKDDGGQVVHRKGRRSTDKKVGDWIWAYPEAWKNLQVITEK